MRPVSSRYKSRQNFDKGIGRLRPSRLRCFTSCRSSFRCDLDGRIAKILRVRTANARTRNRRRLTFVLLNRNQCFDQDISRQNCGPTIFRSIPST